MKGEGTCSKGVRRSCLSGLVGGIILTIVALYLYNSYRLRVPQRTETLSGMPSVRISKHLPDIIIIGAKKCGTKALITVLGRHPKIKAAKGEVHFFDRNYSKGLKWYLTRMPLGTDDQLVIEKTPSYFVTPKVPQRVSNFSKTVKLLLIVRDPVVRVISHFTQIDSKKAYKKLPRPKIERIIFNNKDGTVKLGSNAIEVSQYDVHFQQWLNVFPKEQIFVVDGDGFISNPLKEVVKVEQFLNIESFFKEDMFVFNKEKGFYCWREHEDQEEECLGDSKGRPHPNNISSDTTDKLKTFFQPHTKKFCSLANVNFSWCTP